MRASQWTGGVDASGFGGRRVARATSAVSSAPLTPAEATARLYPMRWRDLKRFFTSQRWSYILVCVYLFFEYVRPQSIYGVLDVLPWTFSTIILCLLAFFLEGKKFRVDSIGDWLLILYSLIVIASTITAYRPDVATSQYNIFFSWVLIYLLIANIVVTERRYFLFVLLFMLFNYKMAQHGARAWIGMGFGFERMGVTGTPGWFQNSGEFGVEMCIFMPIAVFFYYALRRFWQPWKKIIMITFPIAAALSILAATSRGALLGGIAVLLWFLLKSKYKVRALLGGGALIALSMVLLPPEEIARFRASGSDPTSLTRLRYWTDAIQITKEHPFLGIGYGNWLVFYRNQYDPTGQLPHNIFLQASAELGYTGFVAFVLLILGTFYINYRTRRLLRASGESGRFMTYMSHGLDGALVSYLVTGFFVTVLYYPFFWINLAFAVALQRCAQASLKSASLSRPSPFLPPSAPHVA